MGDRNKFRRGMIIPKLITQIKGILEQYPDDGQILKEIIQNAEDAGATKVVFLMDHSTYGVDPSKLHHPGLAKYQGPALFAYNDALFLERDWRGIRTLHESIKADDPLKVGKFGLGFKSIFHMTDLPSIYSGHIVGFIDPHKRFFKVPVEGQSQPKKTTCYDWDFQVKEDLEEIQKLSHQFQPYKQDIFGTNGEEFGSKKFQGTMFRFPLRNRTMHSDLSTNCYDGNKMKQLLKSLEAESDIIFLFFKRIRHIEFYEKINDETIKLLDIRIPDSHFVSANLSRMELSAHITSNALKWYTKDSKTVNYVLPVQVTKKGGEKKLTTWMVTQHFGGKSSQPTKEQSVDDSLPLVGIASKSICDHVASEPYGQIFCFMPLPQEEKSPTGFYFHVHGSFAVDQNRRHLKWMSADQDPSKITDKDLLWNNFLLEKLLPVCLENHYKFLVDEHKMLIKNQMDIDSLQKAAINIYSILPNEDFVNHHWTKFVTKFRNSIIHSLELFSITTLTWKSKMTHILDDEKDEIRNINISILTKTNFDLAQLPKHLMQFVTENVSTKLSTDCIYMNYRTVQQNDDLCSELEKIILLKYFLENLTNIKILQGIKLLPLMDDTWIHFELKSSNKKILICNEQYPDVIFPALKHQFLSSYKLPKNFDSNKLIENFNLHRINKNIFSNLLKNLLKTFVKDEIKLELIDWFNYKWLANVWICLKRDFQDLSMFMGLHLLLVSDDKVLKLTQKPTIIGTSLSEKGDKNFKNICQALKINFVETHKDDIYNHPFLWDKIILPPKIKSILKFLMKMSDVEYIKRFDILTSYEIGYFVTSIVSEMSKQPLTNDDITLLRKLKIFKTIKGSGKQNVELVSLSDVNVSIKVCAYHSVPVPSFIKLVDLSKDSTQKLAMSLSIRLLDNNKLLNEAYIPGIQNGFYTHKEVQFLMKHICKNFENISANSIAELKRLSFVSRGEDGLARPQDLFDHEEETLTCLLSGDNFADKKWRNPEFHCALTKLGLKSLHHITSEDCFKIVENIDGKSSQQNKILLDFINKRNDLLNGSLRYQIKDICWIKINKLRPYGYPKELKYLGEEAVVEYARFGDVISSEFEKAAGSTCLFTDCKDLKNLEKLFGWDRRPSLDLIVQHLKNLIDIFPSSNNLEMSDIVEEIYTILNSFSEEELNVSMDDNLSWVWTGDRFVPPKMVVKNQPKIDLKPYIYALPTQFQQFNNLWKSVNISLEADFIKLLSLINIYHKTSVCSNKDMVDRDLNLAVSILNHLADDNTTIHDQIYVPIQTSDNSSLQMQLIENCVYCDKNWYQSGSDIDDLDSSTHLINEKIPMKTAEKLNIASCLSKLLNVEEFQCSWGQEEFLTTSSKNISKEYTGELIVLKELIQNDDDAGSTEIISVHDERRNKSFRDNLLDEHMKELQGDTTLCHNNTSFGEGEFKDITKLRRETKNCLSIKAGRFGLGINSVYNLKDVLIFLNNDSQFHPNAINILKSLLFHIDVNNASNLKNVLIIPTGVPFFDTDMVQGRNVFLMKDCNLKNLFTFLKFKCLTVAYTSFLLDTFKYFTSEKQLEQLKVIRYIVTFNDEHFIQRLKNFEFINYNGQLRKASYFHDRIEIFEIMETRFLPKPFDSWEWRDFVIKCGLITELSEQKFLEYAEKISCVNFDTYRVQSLMVDWLTNNIWQKVDNEFLKIIESIPFMYLSDIDESLLELHQKFGNERHVSFKNSNLNKNSRLCWTVSNILPQMVDQLTPFLDLLNVKTSVDSNTVLTNLRNISGAFEKRPMVGGIGDLVKSLTEEHLLWFNAKTLDEQTLNALKNIRCLFIDEMHALVSPDQVVVDICLKDQIYPYVVKLPSVYWKCENLLFQLGMTIQVTVEQCARSLEELKNIVSDKKMDPNNKYIAQKLFKTLFKKLSEENTSEFDSLKRLYVPCEGDILCDSKGIYCSSNRLIKLKKMALDRPIIVLENVELLLKLPELIRPKQLDEYFTEEISSIGKYTTVPLKLNSLKYLNKPFLGTEIKIEDHFHLVQDFCIFYPAQMVAYEIDDPFEIDEDGEPKYMLVEIITKQENAKNISKLQMKYEIDCGSYNIVVSALKLYAFTTTVDNKTVIVLPSNHFENESLYLETLTSVSEIMEELKVILKDICKVEELERKKAIKRLYLRYHPDKNPDYRQLYDEVFKHLKILINKLENEQSIDDYNFKSTDKNNNQKPFDCDNYNQDYFERMNRRAKQHHYAKTKKGEKTFQNMYGFPRINTRAFFNNLSKIRRNDPKNAELWMKQAHHDIEDAVNDINSSLKSPQWVCIKFYQAIKNAITAVNYSKDANQMPIIKNQLKDICSEVYDQDLDSLVEQADKILVTFEYLTQPHINHPAFENITQTMACNVSEIAKKIICRCDELITLYNDY